MANNKVESSQKVRSILLTSLLAIASSLYATSAQGVDDGCAGATPVDLNSSMRGYSDKQGEPFFFRLEVPSPGILAVNAAVPGTAPAEPKLGFVGRGCGAPKTGSEPVVLERSATHLVLIAQASGSYLFRVASQDPSLPLHELKLRTGFASNTAGGRLSGKGGEDEEEIEIEADSLVFSGQGESRSLQSQLHELCRRGEVDDHGDSFTCATLLSPGRDTEGEIRNGWGDDDDVFMFVLGDSRGTKLWALEIETTGDVDTVARLYDRFGTRLETGNGGGRGGNFRIARTLGPGVYFVRIGGRDGAEGVYGLSVEASAW